MRGIKHTFVWLFMLTKRYLKKPLFIITILMIPILVLALRFSTGKDEGIIRVGIYIEETTDNEMAVRVTDELIADSGATVTFYKVDSEEKIRDDVKSEYAVCGYVFPENFEEAVKKFVEGNKAELPFDSAIVKCIRKEKTNYSQIADEMIFTSFYEEFSHEVLMDFMLNDKVDGKTRMEEEDRALLEEYYQSYDIKDKLFRFEYVDGSENTLLSNEDISFLMLPIRGMILVLILLAAMTGGIVLYQDKERGVFQSITMNRRGIINYIYVLIPTVLAGAVGLVGMWFAGTYTNTAREIPAMVLYIFLVTGVCNILRRIFKEANWFVSFIPMFLLLNLILCPVFIDLSGVVPQIKYAQAVLPVYYGMNCLYDEGIRTTMAIIAAVLCLGIFKDKE